MTSSQKRDKLRQYLATRRVRVNLLLFTEMKIRLHVTYILIAVITSYHMSHIPARNVWYIAIVNKQVLKMKFSSTLYTPNCLGQFYRNKSLYLESF